MCLGERERERERERVPRIIFFFYKMRGLGVFILKK